MGSLIISEIPRFVTAEAEWFACLIYILLGEKRFGKGQTVGILIGANVLQVLLQEWAGHWPLMFWVLGMGANAVFMFGIILLCCNISVKDAVSKGARAFITAEFTASFAWQVGNVFWNSCLFMYLCVAVVLLASSAGILFMEKKIARTELTVEVNRKVVITEMILAVIIFATSNIGFLVRGRTMDASLRVYLFWIRTLVDFCGICILFIQEKSLLESQIKGELDSIKGVLNLQYQQYLEFRQNSEYISRQCHDLKYQIDAIRKACSEEERENYLTEMESAIEVYETQNISENSVLDTILNRKKLYCLQHNILFSSSVDGRMLGFLSVRDICTIFGNALDNAIEYVSKIDEEKNRQIRVEVYNQNSFIMIRFENYCTDKLEFKGRAPVTTKGEKERHGYGVKSIIYTVEKYGGNVSITQEKEWFIMKILIPIHEQ